MKNRYGRSALGAGGCDAADERFLGEEEEQDENPNNLLCRFEFFEIFVRIALMKFWEKRKVDTPFEAIGKHRKKTFFIY